MPPTNDPPVVLITAPLEGANVTGVVTVTGTATDDTGVTAVFLRVDGGDWTPVTGAETWTHVLDTSGLADGPHTIEARAFDGELSSAVVTVSVNWALGGFEPPMVTIGWPAGHNVSGTINVTGTAADDGGVDRVEVRVDRGAWHAASGTHAWTFQLDTSGLSDGEHTVEAAAYDLGGRASKVVGSTFVVTEGPSVNQPPTVSIWRPMVNITVPRNDQPYRFLVGASDDVEVVRVQLRLDGAGEWTEAVLDGTFWVLEMDTRALDSNVDHTVEARAFDGELYSTVVLVRFTMSLNWAPHVIIDTAELGAEKLVITGHVTDNTDDIERVQARFEDWDWVDLPFEPVNGSYLNVTWSHTIILRGLFKDRYYNVSFRAYDGHDYSLVKIHRFQRKASPGGGDPWESPGPAPFLDLLAIVAVALVLHRARCCRL